MPVFTESQTPSEPLIIDAAAGEGISAECMCCWAWIGEHLMRLKTWARGCRLHEGIELVEWPQASWTWAGERTRPSPADPEGRPCAH